jgi:hypothetical protein
MKPLCDLSIHPSIHHPSIHPYILCYCTLLISLHQYYGITEGLVYNYGLLWTGIITY